ncbi:MAG: aspartate 1-decarboxylase [Planctomycetaceae bacterium]|nr:MAG: aspartate 1-decarboxylase [Planctomycetaceae bacterium]
MHRVMLKSKIHRATVTAAELHYEGSITIDARLMEQAGLLPFEQVEIYDVHNGQRLTTYAIPGPAESGQICINGAAARLVHVGDLIIICAYGIFDEGECRQHQPRVVHVDAHNRPLPA